MAHGRKIKMTRQWLWSLILITFMLLGGCSTTCKKDGPPPFDVDVSKIPDAVPKREALSKSGNMPVYRVFGQSYHVMRSAKHFEQRGIASWYGMQFHKRSTSSGERYNLLAMTAAHKTLPLPTYVQVTNLSNGKKVIVKVNDRGPFAENRIIDLSYVAAKKLGMLGRGTAYVDVKAIDPDEANRQPELFAHHTPHQKIFVANHSKSMHYLQVGAFSNKMHAEKLKMRLMPLVKSPIEVTHLASNPKKLYRVKIGPIKDYATAKTITRKLRAIGLTPKDTKV